MYVCDGVCVCVCLHMPRYIMECRSIRTLLEGSVLPRYLKVVLSNMPSY